MAASITTLPEEIRAVIFDHLDGPNALLNLSCCSHRCYSVALPYLYRNVRLELLTCSRSKQCGRKESRFYPGVYNLTCRVLRDESIAILVRSITVVQNFKPTANPDTPLASNGIDGNVQRLVHRVRKSFYDEEAWLKVLCKSPNAEAVLALLLPSLPCLERLDMGFGTKTPYCNRMLRDYDAGIGYPDTAFRCLQRVSNSSSGRTFSHEQVATFLRMPAFKHFSGCVEEWQRDTLRTGKAPGYLEPLEIASSDVASITLHGAVNGPRETANLVRACRALTSFEVQWRSSILYICPGLGDLDYALAPAAHSLESLKLYYPSLLPVRMGDSWPGARPAGEALLPSLKAFPRLRTLKLGMFLVLPVDIIFHNQWDQPIPLPTHLLYHANYLLRLMPPNVETLHLVRHEAELILPLLINVGAVLSAVEASKEFPFLRRVIVECRWNWDLDGTDCKRSRKIHRFMNTSEENHRVGAYGILALQERGRSLGIDVRWASEVCTLD